MFNHHSTPIRHMHRPIAWSSAIANAVVTILIAATASSTVLLAMHYIVAAPAY